jgi:hypothetical protein
MSSDETLPSPTCGTIDVVVVKRERTLTNLWHSIADVDVDINIKFNVMLINTTSTSTPLTPSTPLSTQTSTPATP